MSELDLAYSITASDSSRFVVGNGTAAMADPDWVGFLDPENAVTGLLDGADMRANVVDRARVDGAQVGPGFSGQRSGTIQGFLDPRATIATVEGLYAPKMRRVLYAARRADALLQWTPSYDGIGRQLRVRHVGRPDVRGRWPKTFLLALTSGDDRVLSATAASVFISLSGSLTDASAAVDNQGDAPTWPVFEVRGPLVDPTIHQGSSMISLTRTLADGEKLYVYPVRSAVIFESTTGVRSDAYGALNFGMSTIAMMAPGAGTARITCASSSGANAGMLVTYHHAWP